MSLKPLAPFAVLLLCVSAAFAQGVPQETAPAETANDAHAAPPAPQARGEGNCETFGEDGRKSGVVWCGTDATLPLSVLVERSAPILWFSPREPLLNEKIPQPLPCGGGQKQGGADSAVVYYQIRRIVRRGGGAAKPYDGKTLNLDRIEKLTLKYYFYYSDDTGFQGHQHDLENIELEVRIEKEDRGPRYRARVVEVIGAAHGVHWWNNRLRVVDDTVFPITIFVERGKHASAPDSQGDGHYEHGSDVNKRVNDAWGLRDKLSDRKRIPLFSYYLKRHTDGDRPENPKNRIGSRSQVDSHPDIFRDYKGKHGQPETLYELKELGCGEGGAGGVQGSRSSNFNLAETLKRRRAGLPPTESDSPDGLEWLMLRFIRMEEDDNLPENLWEKAVQFSYRYDGSHGFAATPPLPVATFFGGYVVPRVHFTGFSSGSRRYGLDYLYTPSASRWADWYAAGGIEWFREGPGRPFKFGPAFESGVKFRFPLSIGKRTKLFLGGRVGVRTSPTSSLTLVGEPGGGLF
ncbi:MAG TPA: hypothetical protein VK422_18335 [Pyrinomonadaceae bacterium]|nr:hypothetical protein [Pyrinomonadaceae bacterium]